MDQYVKVTFKKGKVYIQAEGYEGAMCEEATRKIEEAIGKVSEREYTPDYYQLDPQEQQQFQ